MFHAPIVLPPHSPFLWTRHHVARPSAWFNVSHVALICETVWGETALSHPKIVLDSVLQSSIHTIFLFPFYFHTLANIILFTLLDPSSPLGLDRDICRGVTDCCVCLVLALVCHYLIIFFTSTCPWNFYYIFYCLIVYPAGGFILSEGFVLIYFGLHCIAGSAYLYILCIIEQGWSAVWFILRKGSPFISELELFWWIGIHLHPVYLLGLRKHAYNLARSILAASMARLFKRVNV